MFNKIFYLFSIIMVVLVCAGCSFNTQNQQQVKEVLQDKGFIKLLSPEEYKTLIDMEVAKLAREKLLSPRSEDDIIVEEVAVEIQEIKNNCNLILSEVVVLPADLNNKIKKGYICRYVKGGVISFGRTDNFTIKFFNENPFEFGIDDQINFPTSFGYIKFKNITGTSLVERQANIITLLGEVYLESVGASVISDPSVNEPIGDVNEDFNVGVGLKTLGEINSNAKIYLILPDDEGKRGERIGCGDSLIDIGVNVDFQSSDKANKIKIVLDKLFSIENKEYSVDPLIINPLHKSYLSVESVKIIDKKVYISLVGSLDLEGICDTPRFEEQIKAIAKQFGGIENVEIVINPLSEKDFF